MASTGKSRGFAGFDPQGCAAFLAARHPVKTAAAVAAATGDPARTVEGWLALRAAPSAAALGRLLRAYGPAFGAAAFPGLAWLAEAAMLATYDGLDRQIQAARDQQARLLTQLRGRG